jgi:ABC-type sugar transport system ATPase subunit
VNAIEPIDLTRRFGERVAVDALNLAVAQGELFALLGQNGAGKPPTIKMLCGLVQPTATPCSWATASWPTRRRQAKINVSPKKRPWRPTCRCARNLELIARLYGSDARGARARASELLTAFELEDRAKERARTLSGGLQRRLSIAMALISQPRSSSSTSPPSAWTSAPGATCGRSSWGSRGASPSAHHPLPRRGRGPGRPHRHHARRAAAALGTAGELEAATGQPN